jgi:dTDP-4-amino-4,6-dideoxygalactose transaminase
MIKEINPIYVTMPSLAPHEEYTEILQGVWQSRMLTNNGPLVNRLEGQLRSKLGLDHFKLVSNGTIALQMAIKALDLKGEIITSAFTWVATVSAIKWEGCTPVFVDIDPNTLNIDPTKIEAMITKNTVAIMPIHVFGNPCDVEAIENIAQKHGLRVIYDAAHAIGTTWQEESILSWGDISTISLHATKLLNTGEGGACITSSEHLAQRLTQIRDFGHNDEKDIVEDGFNGKLSELHAALGLANFKYYDEVLLDRKCKCELYKENLTGMSKIRFQVFKHGESNYSYFSIIFDSENLLLKVEKELNSYNIFPRRYFYPSVNTFNNIVEYSSCPVSEDLSKRILCLPLYWSLEYEQVRKISEIIKKIL